MEETYSLIDIGVALTNTADRDTDVVIFKVVSGQKTSLLVEGGREEHIAVIGILVVI